MSTHAVHWSEGMLLRPQHFQAGQRHLLGQIRLQALWNLHHYHGLRHFDLDPEALSGGIFKVRSLAARLRDGTIVNVPGDGELSELDLTATLATTGRAAVSLALPTVNLARPNANDETGRYVVFRPQEKTNDENTGQNGKPIEYRRFNLKLLTDADDPTGYETLPLARLERPAQGEGAALDLTYIPPILACDAWPPLRDEILNQISYRIGAEQRDLLARVNDRNIGFGGASAEDARFFAALRVVNEAYLTLRTWSSSDGHHPFPAYLELVRLVGQLAIFDTKEPLPDLPNYDHDDLGHCFLTAKKHINRLLDKLKGGDPGGGYLDRAFRGNEQRLEVAIEPAWLAPAWQLFVGVSSTLPAEQLRQLLEQADRVGGKGLAMKLGSADKVDAIWSNRMRGLGFEYALQRPPVLPPQYVYFRIRRDEQDREWQRVTETLELGLRLSESAILSNIQGLSQVPIRIDAQTTAKMEFRLFVLPPRKG